MLKNYFSDEWEPTAFSLMYWKFKAWKSSFLLGVYQNVVTLMMVGRFIHLRLRLKWTLKVTNSPLFFWNMSCFTKWWFMESYTQLFSNVHFIIAERERDGQRDNGHKQYNKLYVCVVFHHLFKQNLFLMKIFMSCGFL